MMNKKENSFHKTINEKLNLLKKIPNMYSEINMAINKISSCIKNGEINVMWKWRISS